MKKPAVYYAKASVLFLALFLESFYLSQVILGFVRSQNFFIPEYKTYAIIILIELLLIVTSSLMIGAWDKWEKFLFTPIPIILGIAINIFPINSPYSIVFLLIAYLLLCYDTLIADQLKTQLLVFNPKLILKFTSKAITLVFSLMAAVLIIINAQRYPELNIGNKIGEIFDNYFMPKISYQIDTQVNDITREQKDKLSSFGLEPGQLNTIENAGLFSSLMNSQITLKDTIAQQVNGLIEPYKRFFNPIMAILVFTLLQFLGAVAYFMHTLIVDLIFWFAKKIKFIKIDLEPAQKEVIHF